MGWKVWPWLCMPQAGQGCGAAVPYGQHHPTAGPGFLQARGPCWHGDSFLLPQPCPEPHTPQPAPGQPLAAGLHVASQPHSEGPWGELLISVL